MTKRLSAFFLLVLLIMSLCRTDIYACNEIQSETYISQILFGDSAYRYSYKDNAKILFAALYLCSEQTDGNGQEQLELLKTQHVSRVPALSDISISENDLLKCVHNCWEYEYSSYRKQQNSRKQLLRRTVNSVFNFGIGSKITGKSQKGESFAALLYYLHIFTDYLGDNPAETSLDNGNMLIPSFSGKPFIVLNNNEPEFSYEQKQSIDYNTRPVPTGLDDLNRCGSVYAILGKESMSFVGPRPNQLPNPVGYRQSIYSEFITTYNLYNRCHLVGHQFCGIDNLSNLITGTRYLNETMEEKETDVADYIKATGNHVLYRVTPIYKGDNQLASGVQMEAYSMEDAGRGIKFNIYCYNVQPGIEIDYRNGNNAKADLLTFEDDVIPFATPFPSNTDPDLMFEINKHLEIVFEDQVNDSTYINLKNDLEAIASRARHINYIPSKPGKTYADLKAVQYEYLSALKNYIPILLQNEPFFQAAFK